MNVQAVFLDRDGVINHEVDLLRNADQLRLIPGSAEAIRRLNDAHILVIVVTNQPVVARALCSEDEVRAIHRHLEKLLRNQSGAYLDAIFFCPHHPETHHADGDPKYRGQCRCRKPSIGMLEDARRQYNLRFDRCYMIGDSTSDILAGQTAGCQTILVKTGYGGKDGKHEIVPTRTVANLFEAVSSILADGFSRETPTR